MLADSTGMRGTIFVTVHNHYNNQDTLLEGAVVKLAYDQGMYNQPVVPAPVTDNTGWVHFSNIPYGYYYLRSEYSGQTPCSSASIPVSFAQTSQTVRIDVNCPISGNQTGVGSLRGVVREKDSLSSSRLSDATVTIDTSPLKTYTTNTNSYNYSFDNIPEKSSQYIVTAAKTGYTTVSKSVAIVSNQASELNFELTKTTTPPISPGYFELRGKTSDENSALVGGVSVAVSCQSCSFDPWRSASQATAQTSGTAQYNYNIPSIYNIAQSASQIPNLKLEFTPPANYYIDYNKNGIDDDSGKWVTIEKTDISLDAASNQYVAYKDVVVRKKVSTTPTLTANLTVTPSSGASPLETTLTATAGGTATGTMNYTFWWDCASTANSVSATAAVCGDPTNATYGAKFYAVSELTKAVKRIYSANSAYTFKPKVIIERGTANPATTGSQVAVAPPDLIIVGQISDENNHILGGVSVTVDLSGHTTSKSTTSINTWQILSEGPQVHNNYMISDSYKLEDGYFFGTIVFSKDGYEPSAILLADNNYQAIDDPLGIYLNDSDIITLASGVKVIYKNVRMVSATSTNIKGKVTDDSGKSFDQSVVKVGYKIGGYDRTIPFDQALAGSDLTNRVDDFGNYILPVPNSQFPLFGLKNNIQVEICAQVGVGVNSDNANPEKFFYGCYTTNHDLTTTGVPDLPQLLTIQKGQTYLNINIKIKVTDQQYKIHFLRADTDAPIDLTKQQISVNLLQCEDTGNIDVDCVYAKKLDESDPSHSTYIYFINYNAEEAGPISNFRFNNFESSDYILVPYQQSLPMGDETNVYLTPKSNRNNAFYCEQHGGMWFASYKAEKDEMFTSARRVIFDQMGALYVQLSYSANMQVPTFFIADYRGGAYESNPINAGCLTTKSVFSFSTSYIDKKDIRNWVHEIGHIIDSANGIVSGQPVVFSNNFDAGQNSNCNGKYGKQYPCFSNYAFETNKWETWAEFFATWVTQMDKINAALADPKVDQGCKNVLLHLMAIMNQKFPNMPHYGLEPTSGQTSQSTTDTGVATTRALGVSTAYAAFNPTALTSIMNTLGYQKVTAPLVKTSISDSALLALTPDQIISGNWLQTKYNTLTITQKASFQLGAISSQINQMVVNNTAVTFIRTQITKLTSTIESWLGKIGFKFTSSKLTGTLLDQTGTLLNQSNSPVANFKVTVGNAQGQGKFDITDSDGKFSISRLPTGNQVITITDPKTNKTYAVYDYSSKTPISTFVVSANKNYTKYLMIKK